MNGYSVRTKNHRLVKWTAKDNPDSTVHLELYDYSESRMETCNRAYESTYREAVSRHLNLLLYQGFQ